MVDRKSFLVRKHVSQCILADFKLTSKSVFFFEYLEASSTVQTDLPSLDTIPFLIRIA